MRLVLVAALLAAGPAFADSEFRQGADYVRLTARPCADATVLADLARQSENPLDYRAGVAEVGGKVYQACWKPIMAREVVLLVYSDGDQGLIPFGALKPVRDV